MPIFLKWILDYILGKVGPLVINFTKSFIKKKKIDHEVDDEEDEIHIIREEIWEYLNRTGDNSVPEHLEKKLRAAVLKRNRDM